MTEEIISAAHLIGGEGFDVFNSDDINELLTDVPLSDEDVIELVSKDAENPENDSDDEIASSLTSKTIAEILQTCDTLQEKIMLYEPDTEKVLKINQDLNRIVSGYREQQKQLKTAATQKTITSFFKRIDNSADVDVARSISDDSTSPVTERRKRPHLSSDSDDS